MWAHGGLPCGEWSDLRLSRNAYINMVQEEEYTIADKGYNDTQYFLFPTKDNTRTRKIRTILARHETINRRIKQFRVMGCRFRHQLHLHPRCFHAVINLIEITIENCEPLYQI